ncbi:MAG: acyl-CoA/acyl-ACP dehydrogenase [Acidimicrobiia bacterium]|nr:acyl-CoA/acyl-ACP dehydrogenase [Acidimicrobiia bacterium]
MAETTATTDDSVDQLLIDSAEQMFGQTCTFDAVQAAEDEGWAPEIWQAVAEAGFAWIGVPVDAGGSGGTLIDACEVLRIAGSRAAPIPLAETGILGGWLLASAGLELPGGAVTIVPGVSGDTLQAAGGDNGSVSLSGRAQRVPWARQAERIAALVTVDGEPTVVSVPVGSVRVEPATNVAGEPRDTVTFDGVVAGTDEAGAASPDVSAESFRLRGALSRAMLMAGAMEAMSALTVTYTAEREQFGRPIARFQAVQQHLVWGAQDAVLTKMAAAVAAREANRDFAGARFEIAAAKTVADESASTATRWAHQAHGAMGMTQEYALHHLSRRLWAWRHEYSTPGEWPAVVGREAESAGADGLYPLIAS